MRTQRSRIPSASAIFALSRSFAAMADGDSAANGAAAAARRAARVGLLSGIAGSLRPYRGRRLRRRRERLSYLLCLFGELFDGPNYRLYLALAVGQRVAQLGMRRDHLRHSTRWVRDR